MNFWKNVSPKQWLEWLLPLYVLLLPWQARYILSPFGAASPRYGDLSVYATDALFLALLAAWFLYLRRERAQPHGDWRRLRPVVASVLAFVTLAVISLAWTTDVAVGREQVFRLSQGVVLAMMLASGAVSRGRLMLALALSGAVQGVLAVAQFFMQAIPASTVLGMAAQAPEHLGVSVVEYGDQRWLRAYGSLPHPNMLGAFSGAAMLASAYLYWHGYELLLRWQGRFEQMPKQAVRQAALFTAVGWICAIVCYVGLLFSFSRSAWLATAIGGVLFAAGLFVRHQTLGRKYLAIAVGKIIAVCVLLLIVFSAVFGTLWWQRANDESRLGKQSTQERVLLRDQARALSAQAPVFGSGVGSYLPELIQVHPDQPAYAYQPVHNAWLMLKVELGWVGLALVALTFASLLWLEARQKFFSAIAFVSLFAVSSQFDHFWYSLPFGLLLAAVILALPLAKEEESW